MQKDKYKKRRDTFTLSSLSSGRRGYSPQMDISSEFEYEISECGFSLVNIFNILFRESCFPWEQQWSLQNADYPKWSATRTLDSQLKILLTIYTYF